MKALYEVFIFFSIFLTCFGASSHKEDYFEFTDEDVRETLEGTSDEEEEKGVMDNIIETNKGSNTVFFEGDITVEEPPEGVISAFSHSYSKYLKKELRRHQEYLWITRVVPYEITSDLTSSTALIEESLHEISSNSCIKFVKRTTEDNWIRFVNRRGCYSTVGRRYWKKTSQDISIGRSCLRKGTIQHEVLHSLGVWHEQSRADRDNYVEIFWENIKDGEDGNFNKHTHEEAVSLGSDYDYNSIMHYGKHSFSKNGKPTISAIGNAKRRLGQRKGLSASDIIQLDKLYRCSDVGNVYTTWTDWSECSADFECKKTRQRFCSSQDKVRCPEANIHGVQTQLTDCTDEECYKPISGHWNRWSTWSACDMTCGPGKRTRKRICDDPEPKYGGPQCSGSGTQVGDCNIVICGLGEDDCLFDGQEMCFWEDASKDRRYKWERIKGSTPTSRTGPDGDFSNDGKSYYLYAESSAPARKSMKATLVSKLFPRTTTSGRTITFHYSMHGVSIGSLSVFLAKSGIAPSLLWRKTGPQGSVWKEGKVAFKSDIDYKIIFQAERGNSFHGDIGLDAITFKNGGYKEKSKLTPTPKTGALSKLCGVKVKALGCFAELTKTRAMPYLLDSHLKAKGPMTHGVVIDHNDLTTSLNNLFCDCAQRVKSYGFKYFGLQQLGECWTTGLGSNYRRHGISNNCVNGVFHPCWNPTQNEVCIGRKLANYAYQIID